ncbi:Glutaredoxin 4 [Candidatus Kinetoplastibacterium sorsogonicusi]|uniref:Glutaredoxin n=1 Tax=Candidatus Kinetoplastidibacterium kentomonadis TaxID=1576550 RepID=A0A3Q8ETE8_9PROT|nr:Grx4 family monothiol glutaredoxin [Candidatus Kinetoplastibacterium sorsogonicusi]AWD32216.1 Glutaredoxin 4 [Candidatus Kinetoplastibacterium sorsogonicusi]
MKDINNFFQTIIKENNIVLFMKGTKQFPMCGFSGKAVQILKGYDIDFVCINVLEDDNIRQGIKKFSNWPTIPQLYINQQFIGGTDIIIELHDSGELLNILNK